MFQEILQNNSKNHSIIQVHVYYERFSGGFSGDQFYFYIFYHGDGRFLGERGKVFNDCFQISRRGVGRVGLAKTASAVLLEI